MSLDFSFGKIDKSLIDHPHCGDEEWHPVGLALANLSMPCGYREITAKNLAEVTERVMAYQLVCGFVLARPRGLEKSGVYITPADVKSYIGLTTNAGVKTRQEFASDMGEMALRQGQFQRNEGTLDARGDFIPYTAIDIFGK
jgi:hypothetical protein